MIMAGEMECLYSAYYKQSRRVRVASRRVASRSREKLVMVSLVSQIEGQKEKEKIDTFIINNNNKNNNNNNNNPNPIIK